MLACGNSFYLSIFLRPALSVIEIIGVCILHHLPGCVYRTVFALRLQAVRSIRHLIYLRNHSDRTAISASPCTVHRLYTNLILLAVDELILLK